MRSLPTIVLRNIIRQNVCVSQAVKVLAVGRERRESQDNIFLFSSFILLKIILPSRSGSVLMDCGSVGIGPHQSCACLAVDRFPDSSDNPFNGLCRFSNAFKLVIPIFSEWACASYIAHDRARPANVLLTTERTRLIRATVLY